MPAQLKMFFETGNYDEDMHSFSEKDREYITEKYNHIHGVLTGHLISSFPKWPRTGTLPALAR